MWFDKDFSTKKLPSISLKLKTVCILDLRIITGSIEPESDSASAAILTSSLNKIDIYSNSYIHPPVQSGLYPIGKEVLRALKKGTSKVKFETSPLRDSHLYL